MVNRREKSRGRTGIKTRKRVCLAEISKTKRVSLGNSVIQKKNPTFRGRGFDVDFDFSSGFVAGTC